MNRTHFRQNKPRSPRPNESHPELGETVERLTRDEESIAAAVLARRAPAPTSANRREPQDRVGSRARSRQRSSIDRSGTRIARNRLRDLDNVASSPLLWSSPFSPR
ncbi:hypothetical protein INR49_028269 [Caranx melampygus]|nr:hypothetical protein INR49_028269 [Caranx melampygus]